MDEKKNNIRLVRTGGRKVAKNTTEYDNTSDSAHTYATDMQRNDRKKELEKRVAKHEKEAKSKAELDEVIGQIVEFFTENKSDIAKIKPVLTAVKNLGYDNPKSIDNIDDANKILALISE